MIKHRESGQAILLVVVALGILLIGAMGLAIDAGQLYGHRQMAQAAADSAALSAATSLLGNTNVGSNAFGSSAFTCANGSDVRTPCAYARLNGFGNTGSTDTVAVDFPGSVPGVALSSTVPVAAVHVLITRPVSNTLIRMVGAGATTNVKAAATAALVQDSSPIPILVLHPTKDDALNVQGTPNIQICGGPQRSIQVNSRSTSGLSGGGSAIIDISRGGPTDTAGTCAGTGSDLGTFGGPTSKPAFVTATGINSHYIQPATPISDPLLSVNPPSVPTTTCNPVSVCRTSPGWLVPGVGGCPTVPKKPCVLYAPGNYPSGLEVKNETAVFKPGVYYMGSSGANLGFQNSANGDMFMCTSSANCPADTSTGGTGNTGMLVYLSPSASKIAIGANSDATLVGSSFTSDYKGMLFFVDRSTGVRSHTMGGGGNISLQGTIYVTNKVVDMLTTPGVYQTVSLQGGSGSTTTIKGQIITDVLTLGGNSGITMQLDPFYVLIINKVALVK